MKKSRFTEERIIAILKEHHAGLSAADLCRKHGISDATFYIYGLFSLCKAESGGA
jgi:putative transposase